MHHIIQALIICALIYTFFKNDAISTNHANTPIGNMSAGIVFGYITRAVLLGVLIILLSLS